MIDPASRYGVDRATISSLWWRRLLKLVAPREAHRRHPPGRTARGSPLRHVWLGAGAAALPAHRPAQPLSHPEAGRVGQSAVAIALQLNPLPSAHFRQLGEGIGDHLPVLADDGDIIVLGTDRPDDGGLSDATSFRVAEGLSWSMGGESGRTRSEPDMAQWRTARGAAGRMAPMGFPRSNKFQEPAPPKA